MESSFSVRFCSTAFSLICKSKSDWGGGGRAGRWAGLWGRDMVLGGGGGFGRAENKIRFILFELKKKLQHMAHVQNWKLFGKVKIYCIIYTWRSCRRDRCNCLWGLWGRSLHLLLLLLLHSAHHFNLSAIQRQRMNDFGSVGSIWRWGRRHGALRGNWSLLLAAHTEESP